MAGKSYIAVRRAFFPPSLALPMLGTLVAGLILAAANASAAIESRPPALAPTVAPVVAENSPANSPEDNSAKTNGVPAVLSATDQAIYRRIFALQKDGRWKQADRQIAKLENRILMGHVLFQRYMHPTKYRSHFKELSRWLAKYSDQPGASRIYRLALQRRPAGAKRPKRPRGGYLAGYGDSEGRTIVAPYRDKRSRSTAQARQARALQRQIVGLVRRNAITSALRILRRKHTRKLLNAVEYDEMQWRIAAGYFFNGKDEKAYSLASASAARSRRYVEIADWTAGLAAWRLGKMEPARKHFEALARSKTASPWNVAAGAYWAARVQLVTNRPQNVTEMLEIAASHPRTFYGLLASRLIAREIGFRWDTPAVKPDSLSNEEQSTAIRRIIALHEVGLMDLAEREIRNLYPNVDKPSRVALLGLAERLGLAGAAMRLGVEWRNRQGEYIDSALYPVPRWKPEEGFSVDRALVYAFMRRESGFNARARSPMGARGLMQLMPRTASYVAGDRSLRRENRKRLYEPALNMSLGQRYLAYLMKNEKINHNLFLLAAAYNSGPGNLNRWLRETRHRQDPLMFIESVPVLETRIFIEKVLTNFWIYRIRLGQDTPSLDAIAAGNWPYYLSLDSKTITVAENVQNRR